jgi:hypothetical protein
MKLSQVPEMLHRTMTPSPIVDVILGDGLLNSITGFYGLNHQKSVQESEIER